MMRVASALALVVFATSAHASCILGKATVIGEWGQARFDVALADEPEERSRGLMFVEHLGTLKGMLFVYDEPQHATFWMRNTLIPLDMLFISSAGEILNIHENAIPLDETVIDGGDGIQFVLEVNGGMSRRLGIEVGDVLQHPSIGENAIAPCEN